MASIVAISAIHLLEAFMNADNLPDRKLGWLVGIHVAVGPCGIYDVGCAACADGPCIGACAALNGNTPEKLQVGGKMGYIPQAPGVASQQEPSA